MKNFIFSIMIKMYILFFVNEKFYINESLIILFRFI